MRKAADDDYKDGADSHNDEGAHDLARGAGYRLQRRGENIDDEGEVSLMMKHGAGSMTRSSAGNNGPRFP